MFRYARSMAFPHGQSRRVAFSTGLSRSVPSRSRRYFLPSFFRFFFYEKKHRLPVFFIVGIMPFLLIAALWAFAWIGGDVLYRHRGILMPFIGAYSLLIMFELLHVTLRLYRQIRKHHREEYSNDDDFPVRFAGFVVFLSVGLYHCLMDTFRFRQLCLQHAASGLRCCHACCDSD